MLDNYEVYPGKFIGVCMSLDNCRLFIGSIPKDKWKDEIMEEMKKVQLLQNVFLIILINSSKNIDNNNNANDNDTAAATNKYSVNNNNKSISATETNNGRVLQSLENCIFCCLILNI